MNGDAVHIQRVYLVLLLLHTLAASFIWGINTLFLLDAGLSNTGGVRRQRVLYRWMVLFEVRTGVVADTRSGAVASYLLGSCDAGRGRPCCTC